jgi:hypothetical protein
MVTYESLLNGTEAVLPQGHHRAFLSKMERDQKARQASTYRHHRRWFIFDFSWETSDEDALTQDLARSDRLYLEEMTTMEQSKHVPAV